MGSGELSRLYRSFLACRGGERGKIPFPGRFPFKKIKKVFAAAARETSDLCTPLFVSLRRQLFYFVRVKMLCEIEKRVGIGIGFGGITGGGKAGRCGWLIRQIEAFCQGNKFQLVSLSLSQKVVLGVFFERKAKEIIAKNEKVSYI